MQKPDFDWYSAISDKAKGTKRCPFASASRCPRYYESLFLLGESGITTKITQEDNVKLTKKWEGFEATLGEEAASISGGSDNDTKAMSSFCPEVSYNIFGLFASGLYPHHGEIDRELAHTRLGREGANSEDPRWQWAGVTPRHYTECSEYSILQQIETKMEFHEKVKQSAGNQVFNIGAVQGNVGNVSNSQVTVYDYNTVHRILIERNVPKTERREFEDIMDDLRTASPERRTPLVQRGKDWIVKNKEFLGASAEIVAKVLGK